MTLAPTRSVSSATTTPVTLGVTDPDAIATFLRGVPLDAAFWRRFHYQCDHCQETGTTACGALWRVSLADDCTDLYYLHTRCLSAYRRAQGLRSVEGRLPLTDTPLSAADDDAEDRAQAATEALHAADCGEIALSGRERATLEHQAMPLVDTAPATSAGMWRTWSVADPAVGAITTLYDPDCRAVAYAVGRDDPALVRVAARLNGGAAATAGAVRR